MADDNSGDVVDKSHFTSNLVGDFSNFVDRNIREIKYFSYGLAAIGTVAILKSTHALRKFVRVTDVPVEFIQKNAQLQGRVRHITPEGTLMVNHIPVISHRFSNKTTGPSDLLPVKVAGVELLDPGLPWLQDKLSERHVWFRMLKDEDAHLQCIVTSKKNILQSMCVNEEVVRQGLAHVQHVEGLAGNHFYIKLSQRLVAAEIYAEKKGLGMWTRPSLWQRLKNAPTQSYTSLTGYLSTKLHDFKLIFSPNRTKSKREKDMEKDTAVKEDKSSK